MRRPKRGGRKSSFSERDGGLKSNPIHKHSTAQMRHSHDSTPGSTQLGLHDCHLQLRPEDHIWEFKSCAGGGGGGLLSSGCQQNLKKTEGVEGRWQWLSVLRVLTQRLYLCFFPSLMRSRVPQASHEGLSLHFCSTSVVLPDKNSETVAVSVVFSGPQGERSPIPFTPSRSSRRRSRADQPICRLGRFDGEKATQKPGRPTSNPSC